MRISDWSSDVCSSDLKRARLLVAAQQGASEMNPPKIAVAIATAGRRDTVTGVIERLALQTHRPDFIAICPARPDDVDRDSIAAAAPGVLYAEGPVGLCAQRNALLRFLRDADIVMFIDDDFVMGSDRKSTR